MVNTVAYAIYAVAPHTVANVGDFRMVATIPFVAVGHLRYLHLMKKWGEGEDPTRLLRKDPILLLTTLGWILACALALGL